MNSYQDPDHYDIQFSTRQLALMFGLLAVIVGGVFVGGIVIGRNMSTGARMAVAEPPSRGPIVPPAVLREEPNRSPAPVEPVSTAVLQAPEPKPLPQLLEPVPRLPEPEAAPPVIAPPRAELAEATPPPPPPPIAPTPEPAPRAANGQFTIQIAAFRDREAAERLLARIAEIGFEGYLEGTPAGIFRVRVGRFATRDEARRVAARLETEELAAMVTTR